MQFHERLRCLLDNVERACSPRHARHRARQSCQSTGTSKRTSSRIVVSLAGYARRNNLRTQELPAKANLDRSLRSPAFVFHDRGSGRYMGLRAGPWYCTSTSSSIAMLSSSLAAPAAAFNATSQSPSSAGLRKIAFSLKVSTVSSFACSLTGDQPLPAMTCQDYLRLPPTTYKDCV